MALLEVRFFSRVLQNQSALTVILPDEGEGPFPVLYLFHGLSNDHTHFVRKSNVERYAAARSLAVVMPAVGRSYYADQVMGYDYFTYVTQEVPDMVGTMFPVSSRREDTFAAGLSMGGYGAVKAALRCPERYAAAGSFSGPLDLGGLVDWLMKLGTVPGDPRLERKLRRGEGDLKRSFGSLEAFTGSDNDLMHLAGCVPAKDCPRLYLSCADQDPLMMSSRSFLDRLDKLGIAYDWREAPGGHDWDFWDDQLGAFIQWLPLKRKEGR
jgi:putative tributyrin esterase